jgi:hemerythrin-like domain-containing protein
MKITQRLVGDHISFKKMLQELDAIADTPAPQRDNSRLIRQVELLKDHLAIHAWCEDTFYYPAVRHAIQKTPYPPLSRAYMDHLDDEHKTVDRYLDHVEQNVKHQPTIQSWPQTYALFSKGLRAHMKKEEEELFPLSEELLGADTLEALSTELEKHRSEAPRARFHHSGK